VDLCAVPAAALARLIARRQVSPPEAVEAALARIDKVQPELNAFCFVYAEEARVRARELERSSAPPGPLHGLPIALKDMTPTRGKRTTQGSKVFADWVPGHDAVVAERLLAAGAILVGKTTTPEYAYSSFTESPLWGITRNPWDPRRTPGGSSGGSAVAVATGCVALAEGSDAGGSIRLPAAWCGIVGLKPSHGRIPFDLLESHFVDVFHVGPLARSVEDAALFVAATEGPDDRDLASLPPLPPLDLPLRQDAKGLRIALSPDLGYYAVDRAILDNLATSADALRDAGAIVEEVPLAWTRQINDALYDYWRAHFAALYGRHLPEWRERMDPLVVQLIEEGRKLSADRLVQVGIVRTRAWQAVAPILAGYDALLCPTTTVTAPEIGLDEFRFDYDDAAGRCHALDMTLPFNAIARCPVLQVPSGTDAAGLPTGLQILGRRHDDATVLRIGAALEAARPWPLWKPEDLG